MCSNKKSTHFIMKKHNIVSFNSIDATNIHESNLCDGDQNEIGDEPNDRYAQDSSKMFFRSRYNETDDICNSEVRHSKIIKKSKPINLISMQESKLFHSYIPLNKNQTEKMQRNNFITPQSQNKDKYSSKYIKDISKCLSPSKNNDELNIDYNVNYKLKEFPKLMNGSILKETEKITIKNEKLGLDERQNNISNELKYISEKKDMVLCDDLTKKVNNIGHEMKIIKDKSINNINNFNINPKSFVSSTIKEQLKYSNTEKYVKSYENEHKMKNESFDCHNNLSKTIKVSDLRENKENICTSIIGISKNHNSIDHIRKEYIAQKITENGKINQNSNPIIAKTRSSEIQGRKYSISKVKITDIPLNQHQTTQNSISCNENSNSKQNFEDEKNKDLAFKKIGINKKDETVVLNSSKISDSNFDISQRSLNNSTIDARKHSKILNYNVNDKFNEKNCQIKNISKANKILYENKKSVIQNEEIQQMSFFELDQNKRNITDTSKSIAVNFNEIQKGCKNLMINENYVELNCKLEIKKNSSPIQRLNTRAEKNKIKEADIKMLRVRSRNNKEENGLSGYETKNMECKENYEEIKNNIKKNESPNIEYKMKYDAINNNFLNKDNKNISIVADKRCINKKHSNKVKIVNNNSKGKNFNGDKNIFDSSITTNGINENIKFSSHKNIVNIKKKKEDTKKVDDSSILNTKDAIFDRINNNKITYSQNDNKKAGENNIMEGKWISHCLNSESNKKHRAIDPNVIDHINSINSSVNESNDNSKNICITKDENLSMVMLDVQRKGIKSNENHNLLNINRNTRQNLDNKDKNLTHNQNHEQKQHIDLMVFNGNIANNRSNQNSIQNIDNNYKNIESLTSNQFNEKKEQSLDDNISSLENIRDNQYNLNSNQNQFNNIKLLNENQGNNIVVKNRIDEPEENQPRRVRFIRETSGDINQSSNSNIRSEQNNLNEDYDNSNRILNERYGVYENRIVSLDSWTRLMYGFDMHDPNINFDDIHDENSIFYNNNNRLRVTTNFRDLRRYSNNLRNQNRINLNVESRDQNENILDDSESRDSGSNSGPEAFNHDHYDSSNDSIGSIFGTDSYYDSSDEGTIFAYSSRNHRNNETRRENDFPLFSNRSNEVQQQVTNNASMNTNEYSNTSNNNVPNQDITASSTTNHNENIRAIREINRNADTLYDLYYIREISRRTISTINNINPTGIIRRKGGLSIKNIRKLKVSTYGERLLKIKLKNEMALNNSKYITPKTLKEQRNDDSNISENLEEQHNASPNEKCTVSVSTSTKQNNNITLNHANQYAIVENQTEWKYTAQNKDDDISVTDDNIIKRNKLIVDKEPCNICLINFIESSPIIELLCNHFFHSKCITEWLLVDKRCPLCRIDCGSKKINND